MEAGGWGERPGGQSLCSQDIWVVESFATEILKRFRRVTDGGAVGSGSGRKKRNIRKTVVTGRVERIESNANDNCRA